MINFSGTVTFCQKQRGNKLNVQNSKEMVSNRALNLRKQRKSNSGLLQWV